MGRKKKIDIDTFDNSDVTEASELLEAVEETTVEVEVASPKKFTGYGFSVIGNKSLMEEVTSIVSSVSNRKEYR